MRTTLLDRAHQNKIAPSCQHEGTALAILFESVVKRRM